VVKDVALLLIGAAVGVVVKVLLDPVLERRKRRSERRERWLEDAQTHAAKVRAHIDAARSAGTSEFGLFDTDAAWLAVLRSLTRDLGPNPLLDAAAHENSDELRRAARAAQEAWRAVMLAKMDDENGHQSEDELEQPIFVIQAYDTALNNFVFDSRKILAGSRTE
jgi:hypothetical protein